MPDNARSWSPGSWTGYQMELTINSLLLGGGGGPPVGSIAYGEQVVTDSILTPLSGLSISASSNYTVNVFNRTSNGLQATATFTTDAFRAIIGFDVNPGCNLDDPYDAVEFSSINPGMSGQAGAISFKQSTGFPMSIRWEAIRAGP